MSRENVGVAKAAIAAWNAGDMDAFRDLCDPDINVRPVERWPEPGPFRGSRGGHAPVGADPRNLGFRHRKTDRDFIDIGDRSP